MLESCDYVAGDGTWNGRTSFTLIGVCPDQSQHDSWHSTSCLPDTAKDGKCDWPTCDSNIGFYWAPTALRTELAPTTGKWGNPMSPQLKARATWIPREVEPGVFTLQNRYRDSMFLGDPSDEWGSVQLQYSPGKIKFTEVAAPAGIYVTPTPAPLALGEHHCCNDKACSCRISRDHEPWWTNKDDWREKDYTNTKTKTRNDAEEATQAWGWDYDAGKWVPVIRNPGQDGLVDGKTLGDTWDNAVGSISGSSSTLELGTSADCLSYWTDDQCMRADKVTVAKPTDDYGDMRVVKTVALRFTGLQVPKGATIKSAHIRFTARRTSRADDSVTMKILGRKDRGSTAWEPSMIRGMYTGPCVKAGAGWHCPAPQVPNTIGKLVRETPCPPWRGRRARGKRIARTTLRTSAASCRPWSTTTSTPT